MERIQVNYKPGTAGHIISETILNVLDLPGMHAKTEAIVALAFEALSRRGAMTKTSDIRIVKVLREMVKAGLLKKREDGYVRA